MAGDWIKMRIGLRKHPRVIAMARCLASDREFMDWWSDPQQMSCRDSVTEIVTFENVTRVTVCGLMEVWGAINAVIKSSEAVPFMALIDLDDIAGIPGFGEAMRAVGWVEEAGDNGLIFPNFLEFNTPDSERKKPKSDAERAREYRERKKLKEAQEAASRTSRNVTENHGEKRREEKRKTSPQTPQGGLERFDEFWEAYPRKTGKENARKAWAKIKPDDSLVNEILNAVRSQARTDQWQRDGGQYIPHPATWLNGKRWEDEVHVGAPKGDPAAFRLHPRLQGGAH